MAKPKTRTFISKGTIFAATINPSSINMQPACSVPYFKAGTIPVKQISGVLQGLSTACKKTEKAIKEVGERSQMKKKKTFDNGMLSDEHPLRRLFAMVFLFKCELLTFQEEPCYCGDGDLDRIRETLEELNFDIEKSITWLKQRGIYCDCNGRYYIEDEWGWAE